ncbi:MAG: hypothetical protein WCO86_00820 [Planctomycetota bacterium]
MTSQDGFSGPSCCHPLGVQRHAFNNAQTSMRSLRSSTLVASSHIWPPMFDVVVVLPHEYRDRIFLRIDDPV